MGKGFLRWAEMTSNIFPSCQGVHSLGLAIFTAMHFGEREGWSANEGEGWKYHRQPAFPGPDRVLTYSSAAVLGNAAIEWSMSIQIQEECFAALDPTVVSQAAPAPRSAGNAEVLVEIYPPIHPS